MNAIDQFKAHYAAEHHDRPKTQASMTTALNLLGDTALTVEGVTAWRAKLMARKIAASSKLLYVTNVRNCLRWLAKQNLAPDLLDALPMPPAGDYIEPRAFQRSEIERIVNVARYYPVPRFGAHVLLALMVPERRNDLWRLGREAVVLDHEVPHLVLSASKTRHRRAFDIGLGGPGLRILLERMLPKWKPARFYHDTVAAFSRACAFEGFKWQRFRVTWSSYAKAAGMDASLVDRLLSHTAEVAAARYDDRMVIGVKGSNAGEWYGCADALEAACRECVL